MTSSPSPSLFHCVQVLTGERVLDAVHRCGWSVPLCQTVSDQRFGSHRFQRGVDEESEPFLTRHELHQAGPRLGCRQR